MYELFEHTADLGVHARAATYEALLCEAARGLFEIIAGELGQIARAAEETFEVGGADRVYLLFDWLNELLFAFESRRMLFAEFDVAEAPGGIRAVARGEKYQPGRHVLAHEVKAVTYHRLEVRQTADAWEATFIVDI